MKLKHDLLKIAWKRVTDKWGSALRHVPTSQLKAEFESEILYALTSALALYDGSLIGYKSFTQLVMEEFAKSWDQFERSR